MMILNDTADYIRKYKSDALESVPLACVMVGVDEKNFSVIVDLYRHTKVKIPIEHVVEVLDKGSFKTEDVSGRRVFLHLDEKQADPLVTTLARVVYVFAKQRQEEYLDRERNARDKEQSSSDSSEETILGSGCFRSCRDCRYLCDGYDWWCDVTSFGRFRYECAFES